MKLSPPKTEEQLAHYAQAIAGKTLGFIAKQWDVALPQNLTREKGLIGQLLERALGADAQSRPEPDFTHLGIELKTLPLTTDFRPKESTFVCTASLTQLSNMTWENSEVWRKLKRVLWVPIEASPQIPLPERRIGNPFLWFASLEEEAQLRADWQELTDTMAIQGIEAIDSRQGVFLQIRPKGANAKSLDQGFDQEGNLTPTLPRGFYLRPKFTAYLLQKYFISL